MKVIYLIQSLLTFLSLAPALSAATLTVDTLVDENGVGPDLSLREAITAASSGDTINFTPALSGGTIELVHGYLSIQSKSLTIDASVLPQGITVSGGGVSEVFVIFQETGSGTVNLERVAVVKAFASSGSSGAGITAFVDFANSPTLSVNLLDCRIDDNHAAQGGGGISTGFGTTLVLNRCSLVGNTTEGFGGAISTSGTVTATNCTIACNRANEGAAINIGPDASVTLAHCTVTANLSNSTALKLFNSGSSTLTLDHTIVAANSGSNINTFGVITSLGYNILGDPSPSWATAIDILTNEPKLLEPMVRGGFTKTCGFRPGSPACDAGDPALSAPLTDQRGFARFRDGDGDFFGSATIDIGAFELGETVIVNTAIDELFTFPDSGTSLREALVIAAGKGDGTRITFLNTGPIFQSHPLSLGELDPTSTVWIDGGLGAPTMVQRSITPGSGPTRLLKISSGHAVTLTQINFFSGQEIDGGNIKVEAGGHLNLIDVNCANGQARRGAGIFSNGSVYVLRTNFMRCSGIESSAGANDALGAAIFNTGTLEIENSVISENTIEGETGGIRSSGEVLMNHCTVVRNFASSGTDGVGLHQAGGRAELRYCVFAKNLVNDASVNFSGTILSGATNAEDGNQLTGPDDLTGIDPKIDNSLQPIPFESPLIDRGETSSCAKSDLALKPRITKGSANTTPSAPARADLGAYESPRTLYVTTAEDQNSGETADGVSLREAVALANGYTDERETFITFSDELCGKRIQLLSAMGGTLELQQIMHIRGPELTASSIEISGSYDDPTRVITAADFPVFTFSGPPTASSGINLSYLTVSHGATLGNGGGLRFPVTATTKFANIHDVVVKDCRASNGGGASVETPYMSVTFRRCSLMGNVADAEGGAIHNVGDFAGAGPVTEVSSCTFVNNRAAEGGAIFDRVTGPFGEIDIYQSTFTANSATVNGGAIRAYDGGIGSFPIPEIYNSIVTGNIPNDIAITNGSVLIEKSILGNDPTGDPSNLVTTDAKLGAFGDHGGPTPTVELLPGSPAIDFTSNGSINDQREIPTKDGDGNGSVIRDAGAYEYVRPTIFVTTTADENGSPGDPFTSLREAIGIAQPGDVIQFDLPFNGQTITLNDTLLIQPSSLVQIDARPLPLGVTISGGGMLDKLVDNRGYVHFRGLTFTDSLKEAVINGRSAFSHLRIDACHFIACGDPAIPSAQGFSGGLWIDVSATAELLNSSFFGCRGIFGGVISNHGRMSSSQCVFSGNDSAFGGVIFNSSDSFADFSHCTFLGNSANPQSGISGGGRGEVAYNDGGTTSFHACIFDEDTTEALFDSNPVLLGPFISLGSNIARSNEPVLSKPTDLTGFDPQLGPELIHRIVHYHVPGQFSPAVDLVAGDLPGSPRSDIRGLPRPLDGKGDFNAMADAGAAEVPPLVLVDIPNDENDGILVGSGTSLRDAVDYVNSTTFPTPPVIGFAPYLSGQEISVQSFFGGEILVSKETTIDASNLPENPTVTGEGPSGGFRVFQFNAPGETVRLRCVNVTGGNSNSEGGGIWVTNATAGVLEDCEIFQNFTATHGGGVAATLGSGLLMERCSLILNNADGFGGGLLISDASAQVIQSTFALNSSRDGGGAIADLLSSDIDLRHCTMADNGADNGGGGIDLQHTARISYSILARNQPVNFHDRGSANLLSLGYNLDDGSNGRFTLPSDIADVSNVELDSIQFLGGRTSVMPLLLCSPAVDTGDGVFPLSSLPTDQLGSPRILDGDYLGGAIIDRGAFELDVALIDPDLDGDEIPNDWEVQNGFNPKNGLDAILDSDGDGKNNLAEYVAGTLPGDSNSYFRIVNISDLFLDQTAFLIEWTSNDFIADIVYDIDVSDGLGEWTPVMTDIPATPSSTTTERTIIVSQIPKKSQYFFRVGARRVPPI